MINAYFILIFLIALLIIIAILQYMEIKRINKNIILMEKVRKTLYLVAEKITKANTEDQVYELILETAIELIPDSNKGSILILEGDNYFHFKSIRGYSENLKKLTLKKEESYLYNINNFSGTAVVKNPIVFDKRVVEPKNIEDMKNMEALDITCTLTSPIHIDDKLIGMINVDSTFKGKEFTKEDIELMNYIKNELQLALKNSYIQNKLKFMANFDELTGLFNRRYFRQFLNKELSKIKRYRTEGCLALIDLDDFKYINDNYGHNMGDNALRFFSNILRENIRKSDIYARMSGDEFVILFVNCSKEKASKRLEAIREALNNKKFGSLTLGFSYGICQIEPDIDMTPDDIFGAADKQMYMDKRKKKIR